MKRIALARTGAAVLAVAAGAGQPAWADGIGLAPGSGTVFTGSAFLPH